MSKTWYWWTAFGSFAPRDRAGTYPHPGEVLMDYRRGRQYTQAALAKMLGLKSAAMVYLMEKRCMGLDALSRLRQISRLLDVPPILFGLDSEYCQLVEDGDWWIAAGYPPFVAGDDGYPSPGAVVKYYREQLLKKQIPGVQGHWTQRDLGDALGISEEMVRSMENQEKALDSLSRRQALVFILGIPPALMGLDGLPHLPAVDMLSKKASLDSTILSKYRTFQEDLYAAYFTSHGQDAVGKAKAWITHLHDTAFPLARGEQRQSVLALQSRYHGFIVDVSRERYDREAVFIHADRAISLARNTSDKELTAVALLRRAVAGFEQNNLASAVIDAKEALSYATCTQSQVKGQILLESGTIHAYAAQNSTDSMYALSLFDQAGRIARSGYLEEDENFLKFDIGFYHLRRAMALLALHRPEDGLRNPQYGREALDELELAEKEVDPTMKRRMTLITIFRAQAYYKLGEFADAAILALDALDLCEGIKSELNIARVAGLYRQLVSSSYGNAPKVARLGVKLRSR